MKNNKVVGVYDIPAEFLKALGWKEPRKWMTCARKCMMRFWPEDFKRVVMIPLQKKSNAEECENHRTISLIPHPSKIMLKIFTKRIESKAVGFIGKNQIGFKKGCGTRDAIGIMRELCERRLE